MKKGFTLVELLAVIVILAIISLIATPIVLDMIDEASTEANKRSVELYGKAVENAIAVYMMNNPLEENVTIEKLKEQDLIKYDGAEVVCQNEKIYKDSTIFLGVCNVNDVDIEDTYGEKRFYVEDSDGKIDVGDKVICGNEIFYVMPDHEKASGGTISLITAQNITKSTTSPVQSSATSPAAFVSSAYWGSVTDKTFVYDSNSTLYQYIQAYATKIGNLGIPNVVGTLPTIKQLEQIGCTTSSCTKNYATNTSYWTGNAVDSATLYWINSGSLISGGIPYNSTAVAGLRPIIIIPESEIEV